MFDVVALGELLIDFTPCGLSNGGMQLFEQNPGGAPANVLCALANLGLNTAFIGKVGADMHGHFLCKTLQKKKVDIRGLIMDKDVFTTLAFVDLSDNGERSFSFGRKPGADTCLRPEELDRTLLNSCKIFHFGSLSLTNEPSRSATLEAIRIAKEAGAVISYDPNFRAPLWEDKATATAQMCSILNYVDLIKISEEEMELLTRQSSQIGAANYLLDQGVSCVVITLGKRGAYAATKIVSAEIPAPNTKVVDTTGAGDAFWGGFLFKLLQCKVATERLNQDQLKDLVSFANAVATLCVQKRGAISALPNLVEVLAFIKSKERNMT